MAEETKDPEAAAKTQEQREVRELTGVLKNCETAIDALNEQPLAVGTVTDLMSARGWLEDIRNQILSKLEGKREYKVSVATAPA